MKSVSDNLTSKAGIAFEGSAGSGYIDIHCHCLPAVDDGPATKAEALALCQALVEDGIRSVIATPHQLGRYDGLNSATQIRAQVSTFNTELEKNGITLTVLPGADVRVDERLCHLFETGEVLSLADSGKFVLLELPHDVFIDVEPLLVELSHLGVHAIISHPERHSVLARQPQTLLRWLARSVVLQVTAASLLGEFGNLAETAAWQFLESGWALLVATDAHDLDSRRPRMRAAFGRISTRLGEEVARLVCIENPLRVLRGQEIEAIGCCKHREVNS